MSWVVEQSESASNIQVNGNIVTCSGNGNFGGYINAMYLDPANKNGQYFWQVEFQGFESERTGTAVGITTDQGFQAGFALKAMNYLGNLSSGGALLVDSFGPDIKNNDKVGLLLQLTDADLKLYIFHNDQPQGLAFHVQSPYPKPLYPVVTFSSDGTAKISRSQQIPTSLNRAQARFTGVEGHWKITQNPQNPETVGVKFEINKQDHNTYHLHTGVVNSLNSTFEYNPTDHRAKFFRGRSTKMAGPREEMEKDYAISELTASTQSIEVQGQQQLVLKTTSGQEVHLERFEPPAPSTVTDNIFTES